MRLIINHSCTTGLFDTFNIGSYSFIQGHFKIKRIHINGLVILLEFVILSKKEILVEYNYKQKVKLKTSITQIWRRTRPMAG